MQISGKKGSMKIFYCLIIAEDTKVKRAKKIKRYLKEKRLIKNMGAVNFRKKKELKKALYKYVLFSGSQITSKQFAPGSSS